MTPWSQEAIRRALPGVTSVEVVQVLEAANADVARVRLGFGDPRPPLVAIAKCAQGANRAAARRELQFFTRLAPRWNHPGPALLGSLDDGDCVVLVTEDLGAAGYALCPDAITGPRWHAIVDVLVDFHARFWDDLPTDVVDFVGRPPSFTQSAQAWPADLVATHAARARVAAARFAVELSTDERALLDEVCAAWEARLAARVAGGQVTLVHGDFHVFGNLLFAAHTARPRVIDWSELKPGLGPHDLAYCLHAVPADPDAAHALLHRYWAGLASAGVRGYAWELCQWDFRFSLVTNLFQAVFQDSPSWFRKTAALIAALDGLAALRAPPPVTLG